LAVLVDDERPAVDEHPKVGVDLSVGAFYFDRFTRARGNAKRLGDFTLLVGQKSKGELVELLVELLRFDVVAAYADDLGAFGRQLLVEVTEAASLRGSPPGECGREKEDDHGFLTQVIARFQSIALLIGSLERRRFVANLEIDLCIVRPSHAERREQDGRRQ